MFYKMFVRIAAVDLKSVLFVLRTFSRNIPGNNFLAKPLDFCNFKDINRKA